MTEQSQAEVQEKKEEKIDEAKAKLQKNYGDIETKLRDILGRIDTVFVKSGWVQKGRKIVLGWDIRKKENENVLKQVVGITNILRIILRWLDSMDSIELDMEKKMVDSIEREEEREKKIHFSFEKLGKILAKFDKIWIQNEELEKRKGMILGSEGVGKIRRVNRGLDAMLQKFRDCIKDDPALVFNESNKKKIFKIIIKLGNLKEINEGMREIVTRELKLEKEDKDLIKNLIIEMRMYEGRLRVSMAGYKAFGFPRRAEKVRDVLQTYEGFKVPEVRSSSTHFKTDLTAEELMILHREITPRIVIIYNATIYLWKVLKEENKIIEDIINKESKIQRIQIVKGRVDNDADSLAYGAHESLKKLSSIFYEREIPLAKRIRVIQNSIKRAYDNLKKIENKRQGIEEVSWLKRKRINRQIMRTGRPEQLIVPRINQPTNVIVKEENTQNNR